MTTVEEDRVLRRHLAAVLVGAVTTCLGTHPLDEAGRCGVCESSECVLRSDLRLALMPFDGVAEESILDVAGIERKK